MQFDPLKSGEEKDDGGDCGRIASSKISAQGAHICGPSPYCKGHEGTEVLSLPTGSDRCDAQHQHVQG